MCCEFDVSSMFCALGRSPGGLLGVPWGPPGGPLGVQKDATGDSGDFMNSLKIRSQKCGTVGLR